MKDIFYYYEIKLHYLAVFHILLLKKNFNIINLIIIKINQKYIYLI